MQKKLEGKQSSQKSLFNEKGQCKLFTQKKHIAGILTFMRSDSIAKGHDGLQMKETDFINKLPWQAQRFLQPLGSTAVKILRPLKAGSLCE